MIPSFTAFLTEARVSSFREIRTGMPVTMRAYHWAPTQKDALALLSGRLTNNQPLYVTDRPNDSWSSPWLRSPKERPWLVVLEIKLENPIVNKDDRYYEDEISGRVERAWQRQGYDALIHINTSDKTNTQGVLFRPRNQVTRIITTLKTLGQSPKK